MINSKTPMKTIVVNKKIILPSKIKVKIFKGESGAWIAELPEFDISTESDSPYYIEELLNDLIYVYFDVPHEDRKSVKYVLLNPIKEIAESKDVHPFYFQKFISSEKFRLYK